MDIKKRWADLQSAWNKTIGVELSAPPPGMTFLGMTLGDRLEWDDPWVDVDYPNKLYCDATDRPISRRLMGEIIHLHASKWGWSLKVRLILVPENDPLKVGDEVFRWGDSIKRSGNPRRWTDA